MAKHKINPSEGEVWYHPLTFNMYTIHSVTDDGWVRFRVTYPTQKHEEGYLHTQPTLDFIRKYRRKENV